MALVVFVMLDYILSMVSYVEDARVEHHGMEQSVQEQEPVWMASNGIKQTGDAYQSITAQSQSIGMAIIAGAEITTFG